jgi:DNA-binding response OmpR family regulator
MAAPPPNVLFIDDDALVRDTFRAFFESVGWRYQLLDDSRRSAEIVAQGDFDVVVTDLMMPHVDGINAMHEIRKAKPTMPVMIVTGMGAYDSVLKSLKAGATDYFTKPLDFDGFKSAIERVVRLRRDGNSSLSRYLASFKHNYSMTSAEAATCTLQFPEVELLSKVGFIDDQLKLKLTLALQEAFANALEHGNLELKSEWREHLNKDGEDKFFLLKRERLADDLYARRKISIHVSYSDGVIEYRIRDEGPGFTPKVTKIENPSADELNSYGRGIAIIAGTMDRVEFLDRGREILMVKRVGGRPWR